MNDISGPHATLNKSKNTQSRPQSAGSEFSENSNVLTEVNKSLKRSKQSHRRMVNLDKDHLR